MKRARIAYRGAVVWAQLNESGTALRLPSGEVVSPEEVQWLAPVTPGATIFALGLNYADHRKELGFYSQDPPLIFLKGPNSLVGHLGETIRPADAHQMHPECELVAIVGKPARRIQAEDALDYVGGYTIACDYAIREYLENYFRPNLAVKNRDATTPLGPWVVDATDIVDPQRLSILTTVSGQMVQEGSTADMILDIAHLIAYLSETMTLLPGDMILTGTPQGLHFCAVGDEVVCEIEGIGRLVNRLVAETKT
ncbi:MAG TPA: fumarylacetoacetate hydrolase family protein [Rhizomicrobium sp.]|nr:fumarylacetoacetate hydrolase family protein [Rhizomicrobium sp.]